MIFGILKTLQVCWEDACRLKTKGLNCCYWKTSE